MAIYQLTVEPIPAPFTGATALFHNQGYSVAAAWENYPLSAKQLAKQIDSVMPRAALWPGEMVLWGDEKTNDLRLWNEDGGAGIGALTARIDCCQPTLSFFECLACITAMAGLTALLPDTRRVITNPTADDLRFVAERSRAAIIVAAPLAGTHSMDRRRPPTILDGLRQ